MSPQTLAKPPFPPEVRARLDPALFACNTCGADMEYPASLCGDCRHAVNMARSRRDMAQHPERRGSKGFPTSNVRIPRRELREFQSFFGLSPREWVDAPNMRRDPCAYCGEPGPNTLDHVEPWARIRKSNIWDNATACCRACNTAKGQMGLFQFLSTAPSKRRNARDLPANRTQSYYQRKIARMWKRYEERMAMRAEP